MLCLSLCLSNKHKKIYNNAYFLLGYNLRFGGGVEVLAVLQAAVLCPGRTSYVQGTQGHTAEGGRLSSGLHEKVPRDGAYIPAAHTDGWLVQVPCNPHRLCLKPGTLMSNTPVPWHSHSAARRQRKKAKQKARNRDPTPHTPSGGLTSPTLSGSFGMAQGQEDEEGGLHG